MNATVLPPVATPTRAVIAAPGSPALVEPSSASPLAATAGRSSAGPGPAGRNAPGGDDSAMPKSRPSMRRQGLHGESEERLRELERELQEGEVALREKRAALEVATAAHLIEGTKLGKKLAAVRELTQMMDELHGEVAQCAEAEAEAEATLALQEEVVAARQADVDAAVARTRELQDSLEAAQLEAREAHAYAGRMADQALVAMRDAERGRARGRRAKEQVEVERVRAAEARRRVAPLEEPVAAAEEEYEALEEGAAELEARALETRGRLEAAAEAEFALQRKYEELLRLQPVSPQRACAASCSARRRSRCGAGGRRCC
jgi:chromosome segregation ATPase